MKVLFLTTCFKGEAAGECYYQLARALVGAGCEVTVLVPQNKATPAAEVMEGIEVKRFSYFWPQRLQAVAYGRGIPENLRASWLARVQFPLFMLGFLVRGLALARRADVVHVITTAPAPVGVLARLWWRKPFVLTVIGSEVRLGPRVFTRPVLRFPHRVISATREQDEILAGLGRTWGRCDIKHPIDFSRFQRDEATGRAVRDELGLASDDFVVIFVGRLYEFKDPLTFVRAAGLVRARSPRARFLLVGHGQQEAEAARLAAELGLDRDRGLIMTGHRADVDRLLAASDLFCALSPVENCFAATILEAMTARVPVILTDAGYSAQAFGHLCSAFVVPPRDPEALARAVLTLMEDHGLRRRLAEAGPGRLEELGFNLERIVTQTLALYREVLAEAGRRGRFQGRGVCPEE